MSEMDPNELTKEERDALREFDLDDEDKERREQAFEKEFADEGLGANVRRSVKELQHLWQTEVNAPDLLPYNTKLVDKIKVMLKQRVDDLDSVIDDEDAQDNTAYAITLYQMDLERVRYSLARYLRARTLKIERLLDYLIPKHVERLSPTEEYYAKALHDINRRHMHDQLKSKLSENSQRRYKPDDLVMHATPNEDKYLMFLATEEVSLAKKKTGPGAYHTVEKGTVGIASYKTNLMKHVLDDKVRLI